MYVSVYLIERWQLRLKYLLEANAELNLNTDEI